MASCMFLCALSGSGCGVESRYPGVPWAINASPQLSITFSEGRTYWESNPSHGSTFLKRHLNFLVFFSHNDYKFSDDLFVFIQLKLFQGGCSVVWPYELWPVGPDSTRPLENWTPDRPFKEVSCSLWILRFQADECPLHTGASQ